MPELRELTTDDEWDRAVPILRQLWSHRDESFVRSWREEDDYRLFGWYVPERPAAKRPGAGRGADEADESDDAEREDGAARGDDADRGNDAERSDDGDLVAVAGVSIQRVLHHERHLWIHDFVVDEPERSAGHGAALLARLKQWARERDCEHLALGCVADNDEAFAFYEAQGLEEWGSVLETEL